MRNGVRGLTTPDMNSIARVETVKGPAALLYGQTQPGGVINYITKNPSPQRKTTVRLSAGSDQLFRSEVDTTGPINAAKTFNYRLGATYYTVEKGERQRSLERVALAPMLQWKPFQSTSIVVRYSITHDDIRPAEGLALKPTGAINRGGDPSYFYPFNNLDPVDTPQWVDLPAPASSRTARRPIATTSPSSGSSRPPSASAPPWISGSTSPITVAPVPVSAKVARDSSIPGPSPTPALSAGRPARAQSRRAPLGRTARARVWPELRIWREDRPLREPRDDQPRLLRHRQEACLAREELRRSRSFWVEFCRSSPLATLPSRAARVTAAARTAGKQIPSSAAARGAASTAPA